MAKLTISQGLYGISSVYNNGETKVATIERQNGSYVIIHKFDFLNIKNGAKLGTFAKEEDCLPKIEQVLNSVIMQLS